MTEGLSRALYHADKLDRLEFDEPHGAAEELRRLRARLIASDDFAEQAVQGCERLRSKCDMLLEALNSFMYEFGDKANSATVQKARAAIKAVKEQ